MSATAPPVGMQKFSWFVFGLMASVTFVGILSELVPSGVLPQMTAGLGVSESQVGLLVGVYALAPAVCAIPLVSATLAVNRKKLLLALLIGFAASNIVVAIASSYELIVAARILGGICAGVMWPMIAAYGTRLVPEHMHGKAISVQATRAELGGRAGPVQEDEGALSASPPRQNRRLTAWPRWRSSVDVRGQVSHNASRQQAAFSCG
ncbi:MAG TPA: MFS transporter [Rubrivivax sp.]|nr:MFS transporter [Rubrivivax sp.]